jgi:uncharacterized protein (DUF305 family)
MNNQQRGSLLVVVGFVLIGLLAACGVGQGGTGAAATAAPTAMAGMDHGAMDHGAMAHDSTAPYDAQFIDAMIEHHQGAITMAQQAQRAAERPEVQQLADTIIDDQEAEIAQMRAWRQDWYGDLAPTGGMAMDMGPMEVPEIAGQAFDQRFIDAMIPHHEGAIAMAQDAQQNAERQEIKDLAARIIAAQEAEIAQMREWRQAWFGQ